MNKLKHFIVVTGTMALLAGCGEDQLENRVEITPPVADLAFDEAVIKDRDIYFQMPEDVVLGTISYTLIDAKGNLIVVDSVQWTIFQINAEGQYLRQIGRRGGAEGEYFYVLKMLLAPNGDLYIHCIGESAKYLVFAGDSYKFKWEVPDPNSALIDHIVITEGGNMYASQVDVIDGGSAGAQEDGAHALFRFDDHFNKVASLYPVEDKRTGRTLNRYHNTILTPKTGGGFYFMYPTAYKIHQYSEQGELEQTLSSTYRSKYRKGIDPLPASLDPLAWSPKHAEWLAEHIFPVQLFECDPDLLVLMQIRKEGDGEVKRYMNLLYKDGHSVADGIRVPADHRLLTIDGRELYFVVEGAFDEETGEAGDPHIAVYRLNDRTGAGKLAFSRSRGGQ